MNGYTYGYLKSSILSMMDLTEEEMNNNDLMNKIPFYLNRGMTEICSSVKPLNSHISIYVNKNNINKPIDISQFTDKSFIGFNGRANYVSFINDFSFLNDIINADANNVDYVIKETPDKVIDIYSMKEAHDYDFIQIDYKNIICYHPGYYKIGVKLRWWKFDTKEKDETLIECPEDILDALCLFVASELWSLEDERKGTVMHNKYEMALSRIDDTNYNNTSTFYIEGDE